MPSAPDPHSPTPLGWAGAPDDGLPAGWDPRDLPDDGHPVDRETEEWIGDRDLGEWRSAAGRRLAALVDDLAGRAKGVASWSLAHLTLILTAVVGVGLMIAVNRMAVEVYEAVIEQDSVALLDEPVLERMIALRTPTSDLWVTRFTDLGGSTWSPVIALVLMLLLGMLWRSWTPVILMVVGVGGSVLLTVLGKDLVGRVRPPLSMAVPPFEHSPSFPSGHTLNTTVIVGLAAYLLLIKVAQKRWRAAIAVAAIAFALAMGLSRVYLGHHWLTDVVAGWLLGLGWVLSVVTSHRLYVTVRRRRG